MIAIALRDAEGNELEEEIKTAKTLISRYETLAVSLAHEAC